MGRSLNRQREHPSSDHSRRAKKKRTTADQPPPIGGTHKELKRPPRKSQGRVNVVFQPKVQLQKPNTRTTEETTGTACGGPKPEKNPRTARKKPQRPHPSSCGTSRKPRPPPPDHHQPEGQEGPRTERVVRRAKHLDRHTGTSPRVMWPRVRRPTPTRPPAHDTRLAGVQTGGGPVSDAAALRHCTARTRRLSEFTRRTKSRTYIRSYLGPDVASLITALEGRKRGTAPIPCTHLVSAFDCGRKGGRGLHFIRQNILKDKIGALSTSQGQDED